MDGLLGVLILKTFPYKGVESWAAYKAWNKDVLRQGRLVNLKMQRTFMRAAIQLWEQVTSYKAPEWALMGKKSKLRISINFYTPSKKKKEESKISHIISSPRNNSS